MDSLDSADAGGTRDSRTWIASASLRVHAARRGSARRQERARWGERRKAGSNAERAHEGIACPSRAQIRARNSAFGCVLHGAHAGGGAGANGTLQRARDGAQNAAWKIDEAAIEAQGRQWREKMWPRILTLTADFKFGRVSRVRTREMAGNASSEAELRAPIPTVEVRAKRRGKEEGKGERKGRERGGR